MISSLLEVVMPRAANGQAIPESRKTPSDLRKLHALLREAKRSGDLDVWRRARCVLGYIKGKTVICLSREVDVTRGAINRWLQWYRARSAEGLRTRKAPGASRKLNAAQLLELATAVEAGPQAAGFTSGMWTGPMVGDWIRRRFGVRYHNHHVPYLLHQLGFSVQRPRKRLARADIEAQARWLRDRFPAIKLLRAGELSSSRTRQASGSTELSTRPGRGSATNRASIPSENERRRTSTAR